MKRRSFIKGAVAVAVSASLPGGDGVELYSIAHPSPALLPIVGDADTGIFSSGGDKLELVVNGQRMANALAKSVMQTRDAVAKRVLSKAFPDAELRTPFDLAVLEEMEVDIDN